MGDRASGRNVVRGFLGFHFFFFFVTVGKMK